MPDGKDSNHVFLDDEEDAKNVWPSAVQELSDFLSNGITFGS